MARKLKIMETFPFVHENLIDYLNNAEEDIANELAQTKADYAALQEENGRLREELKKAGQSLKVSDVQENIALKIQEAMSTLQYSGDNAVLKLRQAFAEPNPDYYEIQNILQQTLTEGYLTEGNFPKYVSFIPWSGRAATVDETNP